MRLWIQSIRRVLVFGGFLGPAEAKPRKGMRGWLRDAFGIVIAVIHSFDPRSGAAEGRRKLIGFIAVGVTVAVPIAFLALLIHAGESALLSWGRALGALVAISLVFGMAVRGSRI